MCVCVGGGGGGGGVGAMSPDLQSSTAFVAPLFLHVEIQPRLFLFSSSFFLLFLLLLRLLSIALLLACLILDIPV